MNKLSKPAPDRSSCPIATALDLIGDRWTLLIVRDAALFGRHKNKEFQDAGEKIPTNILADRLKRLVAGGLMEKRCYQEHPPRYEYHLTEAGNELFPVVASMAAWAKKHIQGVRMPAIGMLDQGRPGPGP